MHEFWGQIIIAVGALPHKFFLESIDRMLLWLYCPLPWLNMLTSELHGSFDGDLTSPTCVNDLGMVHKEAYGPFIRIHSCQGCDYEVGESAHVGSKHMMTLIWWYSRSIGS